MSFVHASSIRPASRAGGKLASLLITAVALAIALGSAPAIAGDARLTSPHAAYGLQDDARLQDSDGDGLTDRDEIQRHGTNPLHSDSDRDGVSDGDEVQAERSNPLDADTDGDGLIDGDEVRLATDLLLPDTDRDGLVDGAEIALDADPFTADSDGDGLADGIEVTDLGSSPVSTDSDNDGLADGDEVAIHGTNPAKADRIQLFSWSPAGAGERVAVKTAAGASLQPVLAADAMPRPTVSRVPLAPVRFAPALQAMD